MAVPFKVNGVDLPTPESFSVSYMDLDDGNGTFRSANGNLTRSRITTKRKVAITWNRSFKNADMVSLVEKFKGESFDLTFPDPFSGGSYTGKFYVGDRSLPIARIKDNEIYWKGLSLSLTEF